MILLLVSSGTPRHRAKARQMRRSKKMAAKLDGHSIDSSANSLGSLSYSSEQITSSASLSVETSKISKSAECLLNDARLFIFIDSLAVNLCIHLNKLGSKIIK